MDKGNNMTPEELSTFFMRHGFHPKMKSWISSDEKTKYKLGKNSLQKFVNGGEYGWSKVFSVYYKDIELNPETNKLKFKKMI